MKLGTTKRQSNYSHDLNKLTNIIYFCSAVAVVRLAQLHLAVGRNKALLKVFLDKKPMHCNFINP